MVRRSIYRQTPSFCSCYHFADANGFKPCTDQSQINKYIADIVDLFEKDSRVFAFAYSDGEGLGDVWPTTKNGKLRCVRCSAAARWGVC
jgi:hypothetical protein